MRGVSVDDIIVSEYPITGAYRIGKYWVKWPDTAITRDSKYWRRNPDIPGTVIFSPPSLWDDVITVWHFVKRVFLWGRERG